jgi:hypothetical protein
MGDLNIIYKKINTDNIIFKNPYSKTYKKVNIAYKHEDTNMEEKLILAPFNQPYLFAFNPNQPQQYPQFKDTNICICFNMREKEGELIFCNNVNEIYEKSREHLLKHKNELDLGPATSKQDINLKYPLYPVENNQNNGFKMFVKIIKNNQNEIQTKFFHEPLNSEEFENPKRLTDEEIMNINQTSPYLHYMYPAINIESIFMGPNKNLTMQCKLVEAYVRRRPKKTMNPTPSLKISFKKEEHTEKPNESPDFDSKFEKLRKNAKEHFKQ